MVPFPLEHAPRVLLALALYLSGWWACTGALRRWLPGARTGELAAGGYLLWQVAIAFPAVLLVLVGLFHPAPFVLASLGIACAFWIYGRPGVFGRELLGGLGRLPASQMGLLGATAMVLLLGYMFWFNMHYPADGYDTYGYHRPIAVLLLQERTLFDLPSLYTQINPYPKSGEIPAAWTIALAAWEVPARLLPVFNLFALLAALHAILRNWGCGRGSAMLLTATAPAAPAMLVTVMRDQGDLDINMAACALLIFALGSAILAGRARPERYALLATLAGVWVVGLKGSGPLFALLTAIFLTVVLRWRAVPWLAIGKLAVVGLTATLLFSSYWMVYNMMRYGNPLFPVTVTVGERVLFEGAAPWDEYIHPQPELKGLSAWEAFRESAEMPLRRHRFYTGNHVGGWGFHWSQYAIPAWLLGALLMGLRRRWDVLLLMSFVTVWFLATPSYWWARFSLTAIACAPLGPAAVYLVVRDARAAWRRWAPVLLNLWFLSAMMVLSYAVVHTVQYRFPRDIRSAAREEGRRHAIPQDAFRVNMETDDFRLMTRWAAANLPAGSSIGYGTALEPNLMGLLFRPDYANRVYQFAPDNFERMEEMDFVLLRRAGPKGSALEQEGWQVAYATGTYMIYRSPPD